MACAASPKALVINLRVASLIEEAEYAGGMEEKWRIQSRAVKPS
jgi:hypothetical protein